MPRRLTPIGRGSNTKFRFLDRGQAAPRQPSGARAVVWSSCGSGGGSEKGGGGGGGVKWQTAKGFTERGTKLIERASGLFAGGGALILTGVGTPLGIFFATWGFVQAAYANTQYVTFSRPCIEKETGF